jgi:hypothetical protein
MLAILLMSCLWSPSSIGNISHTADVLFIVMLPILEGDHKQDINSMLMLPILEGDHKQDIDSMANVTNT